MFNFLKKGFEFNDLANDFGKLYEGLVPVTREYERSGNTDKLVEELATLAVWAKEHINDRIKAGKWLLNAPIIVPILGGRIPLVTAYQLTIGKMSELASRVGIVEQLDDILDGGENYHLAKARLRERYR